MDKRGVEVPIWFTEEYTEWLDERVECAESFFFFIEKELLHGKPEVISVSLRVKSIESAYSKYCQGKYGGIDEMDDLVGLKIVVPFSSARQLVFDFFEDLDGIKLGKQEKRILKPADFSFREPKVQIYDARPRYTESNPKASSFGYEVQVTTAVQHAIDNSTHSFDYKGNSYNWNKFRLVGRLRALGETLDMAIDEIVHDIELPDPVPGGVPIEFERRDSLIGLLYQALSMRVPLPTNMVRLAECVEGWMDILEMDQSQVAVCIQNNPDKIALRSFSVQEKIACLMLMHHYNVHGTFNMIGPAYSGVVRRFPVTKAAEEEFGMPLAGIPRKWRLSAG